MLDITRDDNAMSRFRDLPAIVEGKIDCFKFDPRLLEIDPDYNVRDMNSVETREHIKNLKALIREAEGVKTPLVIRKVDDRSVIVAGHCRHAAVMQLIAEGFPIVSVPGIQEPAGTDDIERNYDLNDSNSGLPLTPLAKARIARRAIRLGESEAKVAKRMGWKTVASVKQHLEMLEMPAAMKDEVSKGNVSATTALKLTRQNGADASAILNEAKAQATAAGKAKVTPRAVAKLTGKKPAGSALKPDIAMDFVAAANKARDMGKQAGGLANLDKGTLVSLLQAVDVPLAKARNERIPAADEAPAPPAVEPIEAHATPGRAPTPSHTNKMVVLIERLGKWAEDISDLADYPDDAMVEISAGDLKRAWELRQAMCGDGMQ